MNRCIRQEVQDPIEEAGRPFFEGGFATSFHALTIGDVGPVDDRLPELRKKFRGVLEVGVENEGQFAGGMLEPCGQCSLVIEFAG